jgi:cytochrome c5
MKFVAPEDPENSYLLHKMKGTADSVGGTGGVMPTSGQLPEADIQIVEDWIAAGASCEATTTDTGDTSTDTATSTDRDGATIHDTSCQACHANNGSDLATVVPPLSDAELEEVIVYGKGDMPPQGMTDGELSNIMTYLRDTYPSQ